MWNKIRDGISGKLEVEFDEERFNPLDEQDFYSDDEDGDESESGDSSNKNMDGNSDQGDKLYDVYPGTEHLWIER